MSRNLKLTRVTLAAALLAVALAASQGTLGAEINLQPKLRRPVGLHTSGQWLYVANQRSGTISVVDLERNRVAEEVPFAPELSDLTPVADGRFALATSQQLHQLMLLEFRGRSLSAIRRLNVDRFPVSVLYHARHRHCTVASYWPRRLSFVSVAAAQTGDRHSPELNAMETIDLPFVPRLQWAAPDGEHLVVADAFGGRLALVDLTARKLAGIRTIEGHNIRGLATSADGRSLLIAHQTLNSRLPTIRERVFWGGVVANVLRIVSLDELFKASAAAENIAESGRLPEVPIVHWSLIPLGEPGNAAGDPADIAVASTGNTIAALSGVNQVGIADAPERTMTRLDVGRRPTAVALSGDEQFAFVANTLDDSVSVLDVSAGKLVRTISLGPQGEPNRVDRGEMLFYDARLSLDGWYSCHSCHTDGHTNGLLNDNFGDETTGAPKRIPSLLGVGLTAPYAWNGSQKTLESQLARSIRTTMRGSDDAASDDAITDLAAYVRSLSSPQKFAPANFNAARESVLRGRQVFQRAGCADCHTPPTYTSEGTYDVDLADENGWREFNPPSLIGLSQRERFFHDNRAETLAEVLRRFRHGLTTALGEDELNDLLEFLNTL